MVDDVRSHFRFGLQRVVLFTVPVDNADFIGIVTEARTFVIQRIKHDKIQVLTVQFIFRIMLFVIGFEGKALFARVFCRPNCDLTMSMGSTWEAGRMRRWR